MRLLLEEDSLTVVGAFCVAAFTLAVVWTALEAVIGIDGFAAGVLAFATATGSIEWMSRRHYRAPQAMPAGQEVGTARSRQALRTGPARRVAVARVPAERGEVRPRRAA